MPFLSLLRIVAFVVVLSGLAPLALALSGVHDADLLTVVFAPSVIVGTATGWFAKRRPGIRRPWAVDTQRMP